MYKRGGDRNTVDDYYIDALKADGYNVLTTYEAAEAKELLAGSEPKIDLLLLGNVNVLGIQADTEGNAIAYANDMASAADPRPTLIFETYKKAPIVSGLPDTLRGRYFAEIKPPELVAAVNNALTPKAPGMKRV